MGTMVPTVMAMTSDRLSPSLSPVTLVIGLRAVVTLGVGGEIVGLAPSWTVEAVLLNVKKGGIEVASGGESLVACGC